MKKSFIGIIAESVCLFLMFCFCAHAEEMLIKCKDGVVVRGEVVSMQNGVYNVKSRTLGELSVHSEDVVSMTNVQEEAYAAPNQEAVKKQILGNPEIMASIQDLAKDQSVVDMFSDPAVRAAIMRQDVEYLQQNEKFKQFMNKTSVQGIVQSVAAQSRDSSQE